MDPGPGGLRGASENGAPETSDHLGRLVTNIEQPPGITLQDANIYPENRVITFTNEANQSVYTSQSNAEYVANRELVSPHQIQDGASNFVEGKEVARKEETDATYGETREMVVATPESSSRQITQTPDPATGVQTPEAMGRMAVNADTATSGYGDGITIAVPIVRPQVAAVTNVAAPVMLVPDTNVRPVVPAQPPPQLINTRDLISSVIDSTRHAMPAALSNVSARQHISSVGDSSKRQPPLPTPPIPIYRPVSKPEVQNINSSLKQLMTNPVLREGINVSSGGIYADNYQYFLKADGTVSRVVSAPTQGVTNQTVTYAEKREVVSPVDNKRYIESKELGNTQSVSNVSYIQDSESSVAVSAPVSYIDKKFLKQQQQQQQEQQQETNAKEFINGQPIGEVRYVQNDEDTVAVPMPVSYVDNRILQQVQPETATFNPPQNAQVVVENSNRIVNSSGSETVPMPHAIVSYPEHASSVPPPAVCENLEEGHKDVPESVHSVMNNVVNDTVKAAIESSGIVPPTTEQTSELRAATDNHINHVEMQEDVNRVNGNVDTLQTENSDNSKVNEQMPGPECERNNSLVHLKRCFQFLVEENCEISSDSVQPVLNILKNTVRHLTHQLHKCLLSDQAGFTWEPVTADDVQYLVPSCQCGYAANKRIVDKAQILTIEPDDSFCDGNEDDGIEDETLSETAPKLRHKKKAINNAKIKKENAENGEKTVKPSRGRPRKSIEEDDEDFSPKEEEMVNDDDDDDEDWNAPTTRRKRGRPRKGTRTSARNRQKASPRRKKAPAKSAPKPATKAVKEQEEEAENKEGNVKKEEIVKDQERGDTEDAMEEGGVVPKKRGRPKKPPLPPGEKKEVIKRHVCETCGSKFKHKAELRRHSTVHTGERPFSCEICGQTFKRHGHLYEHRLVHSGKNIVFCPHCNKKLKSKVALRNHIKTQHEKNLQHMCQICGRKWLTPSMLKYHIHNQHNTERVPCPKCPAAFAKALEMREHLRTHTNLPHICFICGDGFLSGKDALAHRDIQHADRLKNRCHQCGRGFQYATELRKHETTVHAKGALPFQCTWEGCTKTFAKEYMMKYHLKMWHECETKACEVCFKQVKIRVYKRHMLTHTGVKDFRCQYCSAAFSQVGNLKRHMRIHTGEKPYKCTYCEKAFNQSNALKQHQQMHLGGSHRDHSNTHHAAPSNQVQTVVATSQIASSQIVTSQIPAAQFSTTEITANQLLTQLTSGQLAPAPLTATPLANQLPRFTHPTHYGFPGN